MFEKLKVWFRIQKAQKLIGLGKIKDPDSYLNFVKTGKLK